MTRATLRRSVVLPTPTSPSRRTCPRENTAITSRRIGAACPRTTPFTSLSSPRAASRQTERFWPGRTTVDRLDDLSGNRLPGAKLARILWDLGVTVHAPGAELATGQQQDL